MIVLLHVGELLQKNETNYYAGSTSDASGALAEHIPCQHGHLTIGCFHKILHSGEAWKESRGCINFNLKKTARGHFLRYGMKHYSEFKCNNYLYGPFFM